MKALIVYYSRDGHTKEIAEKIAKNIECDIEEIRDNQSHQGKRGYVKGALESIIGKGSSIILPEKDTMNYDITIIGSPVWASSPASPVITYAERNRNNFRKIACFATCKGSGAEKTCDKISKVAGKQSIANLCLTDEDLKNPNAKIKDFIETINL